MPYTHWIIVPLAAGVMLGSANVSAQEAAGRYTLAPIDGGIARLDTLTGEISECRRGAEGLACTPAADERRTLTAEVERLRRENERLRSGAPGLPAAPPPVATAPPGLGPSDADIDRALGIMEKFIRRFQAITRDNGHNL